MSLIFYTSTGKVIHLDSNHLAAAGGEGSVHKIITSGYGSCCAKIFHKPRRTQAKKTKLEFMINNMPSNLSATHYIFCWPTELLFDSSQGFVGFIMPLAFMPSEKLYELTTTKMPKRPGFDWNKFDRSTKLGMINRMKICMNIFIAVHSIHQSGRYSIVDYKPQNILITNDGKVSITDVDSFQVFSGSTLYYGQVTTPEYTPPEAESIDPSNSYVPETWDRFALAVTFYEVLLGIHPYTATANGQFSNAATIGEKIKNGLYVHGANRAYLSVIPGIHSNYNNLPNQLRNLFYRAFELGHSNPKERPSAEEWGKTLYPLLG